MLLREALRLPALEKAILVNPEIDIERTVGWAHVIELPDPFPWAKRDQLILSTGFALPDLAEARRLYVRRLAEAGVAALALAVPQRFERCPDEMIEEAQLHGLPLLEIPWEIPFADVTEQVHRALIAEQESIIRRSEEIHRALTAAAVAQRSLDELAKVLGELLHRSVAIEAVGGRLLAAHSVPGMEDAPRRETLAKGRYAESYVRHLELLGVQDALPTGPTARRIDGSADGAIAARVVCGIRLLSEHIGYIWIIEGDVPLSDLDLRAAEHASVLVALQIAHHREVVAIEHRVGSGFLDSVLEGRFRANARTMERARIWGFNPHEGYRLHMALLDETPPLSEEGMRARDRVAADVRDRLRHLGLPQLVTHNLNRVFFLVPEQAPDVSFADVVAHHGVALVFAEAARGVEQLRQAYKDLQRVEGQLRFGTVIAHRDLLVPRLLGADSQASADLGRRMIEPLLRVGRGTTLVETLRALVDHNFVLSRTAEALAIHPSTLRYRYERIEAALGSSLDEPEVRFLAHAALLVSGYPAESGTVLSDTS